MISSIKPPVKPGFMKSITEMGIGSKENMIYIKIDQFKQAKEYLFTLDNFHRSEDWKFLMDSYDKKIKELLMEIRLIHEAEQQSQDVLSKSSSVVDEHNGL